MSQFDVAGKPPAWHTAFFYLAEHVRYLTKGAVNHKGLYSLVGTDGRYLNHENPAVRKRTAGALSRLVHTRGYAKGMRDRHQQSYSAFAVAAHSVCQTACAMRHWGDEQLLAYLRDECWPDVRCGLRNETAEWRSADTLKTAEAEMAMLFSALDGGSAVQMDVRFVTGSETSSSAGNGPESGAAEIALAAALHVLAFGRFNNAFARSLVDRYPTGLLDDGGAFPAQTHGACLVKFVDSARSALVGSWEISEGRPFTIGRYTDCDIVEVDAGISRVHCYVYHMGGVWNFEDKHSRNGSRVERAGVVVYDSKRDGAGKPFVLQHGDSIALADRSFFWFGALAQ